MTPPVPRHSVFVAFGSNVGDSRQIVDNALTVLEQHGAFDDVVVSRLYRTRAEGPAQADYLNGVFRARTALGPFEVLDVLHFVEQLFGRVRRQSWGPRTLDLDLLAHDRVVLATPRLTLPHPRLEQRGFVLAPMVDLDPDWIHPVSGQSSFASLRRWLTATPDAAERVVALPSAPARPAPQRPVEVVP